MKRSRDGKNTWKNYTKKDVNEPDDHNDVVSHPEPDILEREVRRALESTAVSKANGCDGVSVQFSCSVMSDSLRPHESQHTRPPCPSPTPGVYSDSHPSSQ